LFPLPPILGMVSAGIIFAFTYMFTHFLYRIHPPTLFSPTPWYHRVVDTLPPQDLFCPPVVWFCRIKKKRRKKWYFYLFEIRVATQGVSLWYFHVFMTIAFYIKDLTTSGFWLGGIVLGPVHSWISKDSSIIKLSKKHFSSPTGRPSVMMY
jgi:hypothetical protein